MRDVTKALTKTSVKLGVGNTGDIGYVTGERKSVVHDNTKGLNLCGDSYGGSRNGE